MGSIWNTSRRGLPARSLLLAAALTAALVTPRADAAAPVPWLYDVAVPVADQSTLARVDAAGQALAELLSRLTGLASVPRNETVQRALAAPDLYYNQYGYQRDAEGALTLEVQFVPRAVLDLIRAAGLPVWGANRPTVVAWIVLDDGTERRILGADSDHPAVVALRERARRRGVPLRLPLLDLEDQLAVAPAAVWGRLTQTLLPASERYAADIVLVGRLQQNAGGPSDWSGAWEFWVDGQVRQQFVDADQPQRLGSAAADLLADELAARYAVLDRGRDRLRLAVSSVNGPAAYADMLRYFAGLEFVDAVTIDAVAGNRVSVSLLTPARPEQLLELFRLDQRLFPDNLNGPGSAVGSAAGGLNLVWRRP